MDDYNKLKILLGIAIMALSGVFLGTRVGDAWFAPGFLVGGVLAMAVLARLLHPENRVAALIVFGILTAAALVGTLLEQFERTGWITVPIDLAVALAIGAPIWYRRGGRQWLAGRRTLRKASAALGFTQRRPGGALLRQMRLLHPWLPHRLALYGAAEGTVDGTALTVAGRRGEQIWLAKLPFALPQVVIRQPAEYVSWGEQPPVAATLLTPEVVEAAKSAAIVDCRVERDRLIVRFKEDDAAFAGNAATVATIAQALPLASARPYAVDPAQLPDTARAVRADQLSTLHRVAILAGVILPLPALFVLGLGWYWKGGDTVSTVTRSILVGVGAAATIVALTAVVAAALVLPIWRAQVRPVAGLTVVRPDLR